MNIRKPFQTINADLDSPLTSKKELFVAIINDFYQILIVSYKSIIDVAGTLYLPRNIYRFRFIKITFFQTSLTYCSVTKLSHLKARNSAHEKFHHDRGVDTKNVSANHLHYKSNHLWWKYHIKKILIFSSYLCEFLLLLIFLSNNFDFICNNNKQLYFVKMHPTLAE